MLNRKLRGVRFFRTAAFFPYVTSLVAVAVVWNMLFNPTMGPVNQLLTTLGVANPPGWTSSSDWAMPAVIITSVWRDMGYYMMLFLAGLQTIPVEYYEAAARRRRQRVAAVLAHHAADACDPPRSSS